MNSRITTAGFALVLAFLTATAASAQTDYFNTDEGRPLTVEDASATERYAFELQLAPLRLERMRGGVYRWSVEPEIAYGVLPRTQIELGAPISYIDAPTGDRNLGLAGVEVALLHNLNVETAIPALALAADVLLPFGRHAPADAVFSAKAILTRSVSWARFHLNGQYSFGEDDEEVTIPESEAGHEGSSRWLAGISVDRAFPLRSTLVGAEIYGSRPRSDDASVEWNAAVGARRQLSPAFNVDFGFGRKISGGDRTWFATFGLAHAFAIRSLLPGRTVSR